jgi:hydroxymethylpyrimidine/phosphomethylpyrimidine kinase
VLVRPGAITHHTGLRIETNNTHGTGCTLSAAIAAHLALGETDLETAVAKSKAFLSSALEAGRSMTIGAGSGPVDHLFRIRTSR